MDTNDLLRTIGTASSISSINHPCCTPLFGQVIRIQIPNNTDYKYTNTQIQIYIQIQILIPDRGQFWYTTALFRPVKVHQKVRKFGEN